MVRLGVSKWKLPVSTRCVFVRGSTWARERRPLFRSFSFSFALVSVMLEVCNTDRDGVIPLYS
jgi:hypothetical protein